MTTIEQIAVTPPESDMRGLIELLQNAVDGGASLGFLPPLHHHHARSYWEKIIGEVDEGTRILLVARIGGVIKGAVQVEFAAKPNALHRAEVQKLMVHQSVRGQGIGLDLLKAIEAAAFAANRTLLTLDTRVGDAAEKLYEKHGYTRVGNIPGYACDQVGTLHDTVIFYRHLEPSNCE